MTDENDAIYKSYDPSMPGYKCIYWIYLPGINTLGPAAAYPEC